VQEVIRELKSGSESKSVDTTPTIEFDFKAKFAETKAAAKVMLSVDLRWIKVSLYDCMYNFFCYLYFFV